MTRVVRVLRVDTNTYSTSNSLRTEGVNYIISVLPFLRVSAKKYSNGCLPYFVCLLLFTFFSKTLCKIV